MNTQLDDSMIRQYRERGFLAIPDLLDAAELGRLRDAADQAEAAMGTARVSGGDGHGAAERESFVQRINQCRVSPGIAAVVRHPAIGRLASRLEGVAGMRLYLDQSLRKRPWDSPTAFHVDNPFWAFTSSQACSLWIALDGATIGNGCLWYLPGTHRGAVHGRNAGTGGRLDAIFDSHAEWRGLEAVPIELPPGGAVVHNGYTCHGAGPNLTPRPRRAIIGAYMPIGAVYNGNPDILPREYVATLEHGDALDDEGVNPLVWREDVAEGAP